MPEMSTWTANGVTYDIRDKSAAPDGYGLGTTATDISNQNLITATAGKSGFYRGENVTHAPETGWWRYYVNAGVNNSTVLAIDNDDARCYSAVVTNGATSVVWNKVYTANSKPTAAEVGASPAGINAFEASGNSIDLSNSGYAPLLGLKLYGKTTQNGTPTPQSPVPLESAGDSGSVAVTAAGKNICPDTFQKYSMAAAYAYCEVNAQKRAITISLTERDSSVDIGGCYIGMTDDANSPSSYVWLVNSGDLQSSVVTNTYKQVFIHPSTEDVLNKIFSRFNVQVEFGETATAYEPYKGKTLTIQTPNGWGGIPVTSGGNYTDENGQRWVCDEIDFVNGKRIMRTYEIEFDGVTVGKKMDSTDPQAAGSTNVYAYILPGNMPYPLKSNTSALCNYAKIANGLGTSTVISLNWSRDFLGLTSDETNTTVITNVFNTKLKEFSNAGNPLRVRYILTTPIETPLSAEELAQYAALHTHKPNTTIFNNGGANMDVRYCTPNTAVPVNFGRTDSVLTTDEHGCVVATPKFETFAPAGLVHGEYVVATGTDEELMNLIKSIYKDMANFSVRYFFVRFGKGHPILGGHAYLMQLSRVYGDHGHLDATTYGNNKSTAYRRSLMGGTWGNLVDCGSSAFAPAGYGLGDKLGRHCDNINTAKEMGLYYTTENTTGWGNDLVLGMKYASLVVENRTGDIYQTLTSTNGYSNLTKLVRCSKDDGLTWTPWEYENPPMIPGVEYRTTERWNDKPVYKKTISLGKLPASTTKFENLLIADEVVDFSFTTTDNNTEKFIHNNKVTALGRAYTSQYIYATIESNTVLSQYYGYLTISYTKL